MRLGSFLCVNAAAVTQINEAEENVRWRTSLALGPLTQILGFDVEHKGKVHDTVVVDQLQNCCGEEFVTRHHAIRKCNARATPSGPLGPHGARVVARSSSG